MQRLRGTLQGVGTKDASLPSSEAAAAVLNGEAGSWAKLFASTVLRAILIAPGLALGGVREPKKLLWGSLASSVLITGFILAYLHTGSKSARPTHSRHVHATGLAGRGPATRRPLLAHALSRNPRNPYGVRGYGRKPLPR